MKSKKEIVKDLKFCKDLMDRLVQYAEENFDEANKWSGPNHTVVQNDITRLRRELMEVHHKLDWRQE